ncbi:glycosyltransferase [Pseudoalteromonas sp. SMS1]|uniref:glycosyltransferase n=1 Tax=Pseudoalteromonas sp. SMS1 TaxID=2908894 RepID=UPI001F2290BF|nr:glycosyltransferase [Pseudoalteromonas sp. SMS1]MCF2857429.1 glycosyltransferase [Pseudoalteromonas sp. SMS1]
MKKILYVVSTLSKCGPTNQLLNIVKNLDKSEFSCHVLTLSDEPSDSLKPLFDEHRVSTSSLGLSRLKGLLFAGKMLNKFIEEYSPDIIHSQGFRADRLVSSSQITTNKVCSIRSFPQLDFTMQYGKLFGHALSVMHFNAMRKFTKVVGVSNAVTKNIKNTIDSTNTLTIHNGVDRERFSILPSDNKDKIRNGLSIKRDDTIFITSGPLIPRKNLKFLIQAFQTRKESEHLVLVGSGELESELKSLSKGSSNIHILGSVNDVNAYLNGADFYISASKAEGLPNAVMEAMAVGLPCILSDIPPHLEVSDIKNGVGSTFSLESIDSLISSLDSIVVNDYETLSSSTLEYVESHFDARSMSKKYQRIYREFA